MASRPITLAMIHHHNIINRFLSNFEKDGSRSINLFDIFKWNLEKHFFAEEINIFPVTKNNKKEMNEVNNLLKDHRDLREIVDNISEDLESREKADVKILREIMFAHERREIESFYPKLDERLSADEKKELVKRLRDIVLG
jgi:hypothetical protein